MQAAALRRGSAGYTRTRSWSVARLWFCYHFFFKWLITCSFPWGSGARLGGESQQIRLTTLTRIRLKSAFSLAGSVTDGMVGGRWYELWGQRYAPLAAAFSEPRLSGWRSLTHSLLAAAAAASPGLSTPFLSFPSLPPPTQPSLIEAAMPSLRTPTSANLRLHVLACSIAAAAARNSSREGGGGVAGQREKLNQNGRLSSSNAGSVRVSCHCAGAAALLANPRTVK